MEFVDRNIYITKIQRVLRKNTIIILTGQRRVGKSYILRLFRDKLLEDSDANVIFIDKEKKEFDSIITNTDLNLYIEQQRDKSKINYILVDEIQNIEGFELTLRSYYEEPDIELIVTGSNSKMLSSDLSTYIGGRYREIYVQSLSYQEFLVFHNLADTDESLLKYLDFGALPGLSVYGLDEQESRVYQTDVYNSVLLKDVVMRNEIRNVVFLENLVRFLADNEGSMISANSIAKYMKSQGESVTAMAIINYIKYLTDAYIIHKVNRFDIHGKRVFESNQKYYFEDHGIRNALVGGSREGDIERIIENVVYNHLVRLGFEVAVGQLGQNEIDFVCKKSSGKKVYVQVAYLIADEATRKREFGNLRAIKDNYPKYVISATPFISQADSDGITHLHLRRFLTTGLS